ncbi:MAG: SPFH domain-containing protein [Planctomycetaceae bacterium]|jgi:regulator of protease activity HflC (stomatin/prohibitin superfamily)|nr:SPFH domain-containing protein [bacterium]MDG2387854.1 SPFH domain-containing protein [Planctomycetaceae bacterium]
MADDVVFPEDHPRRSQGRRGNDIGGRLKKWFSSSLSLIFLVILGSWFVYSQFRIEVADDEIAVLIRKTGLDMENGSEIADSAEHKGIQREFLRAGKHFRNPLFWDWEYHIIPEVPAGKIGILVSLTGENLPYGEFLAKIDENDEPMTKGIMPEVKRPGLVFLNPYLYEVVIGDFEPVEIKSGFRGVVTNLAGPLPDDPNQLLVPEGFRGVQEQVLDEGTEYINPYATRISLVDCTSQRFNLAEKKDMGFPTKDGFWVSLDGIIEFRVVPDEAASVYVTYNDSDNGDAIDEEIIRKIILPNARSFCRLQGSNTVGRDLISGETRIKFQEQFQTEMRDACEPLGIEIIQALITRINPPKQISELVQERELAKEDQLKYLVQIQEEMTQKDLRIDEEERDQKGKLVEADQEIVIKTTSANKKQSVEMTLANQRLEVSKLRLEAAKDEAAAILARGKAEAEVIGFQNKADAAGWKRSVEAFSGDGNEFARYVLLQKLSPSYRRLMINTADSPIMKIFELFSSEQSAIPVEGKTPTVNSKFPADSPMTTSAENN